MSATDIGCSCLGLGTVQFGLDYGVTNTSGQVSVDTARSIVKRAGDAGMRILDTAAYYGESEVVLGQISDGIDRFHIVTKTPPATGDVITDDHVKDFESTFEASRDRLRSDAVYGLLVHHGSDLLKPGGERLIRFLENQKANGKAAKIGISVYSGEEINQILERFTPDIVQLPLSLADQRLIETGLLQKLKDLGIEIHARSIFLQGVLLQDPDDLVAFFEPARERFQAIGEAIREQGFSRLEACLAFALGRTELQSVIVGVTSTEELDVILRAVEAVRGRNLDARSMALHEERYIVPSQWRLNS